MIRNLTVLLAFQLVGEGVARGLSLPLPGPVIGMALLLVALAAMPNMAASMRETAQGLLAHLSLLFVPAGVGVVGHLDRLGHDGLPLLAVLLGSTILTIAAGALAFGGVARLTEQTDG